MPTLSQRLKTLQVETTPVKLNFDHLSMEQLEECVIDFGEAQKGKTYAEVWANSQDWVLWFTQHYEKSNKPSHQQFIHYVNVMVGQTEMNEGYIPISAPEPSVMELRPKSRAKAKAQPAMSVSAEIESLPDTDNFEVIPPVVQNLESRMNRMEDALARVVAFIETKVPPQGP